MRVKWYGTASLLLENGGTRLLFDPFLTLNDKGYKPPLEELAPIMDIFLTHGHLDHISNIPEIWKYGGEKANIYCTKTPRKVLLSKGLNSEHIREIQPGDMLTVGTFEIHVLKGKHVKFDKRLILKTFLQPRVFTYWKNLRYLLKENKVYIEAGETVIFDIRASGKQILLLGSMNLNADTEYPRGADLLILPFQGRSDIAAYALPFIDRLEPKKVLLDHFDDAFPPISSAVETAPFLSLMRAKHPDIPVLCLQAGAGWVVLD